MFYWLRPSVGSHCGDSSTVINHVQRHVLSLNTLSSRCSYAWNSGVFAQTYISIVPVISVYDLQKQCAFANHDHWWRVVPFSHIYTYGASVGRQANEETRGVHRSTEERWSGKSCLAVCSTSCPHVACQLQQPVCWWHATTPEQHLFTERHNVTL